MDFHVHLFFSPLLNYSGYSLGQLRIKGFLMLATDVEGCAWLIGVCQGVCFGGLTLLVMFLRCFLGVVGFWGFVLWWSGMFLWFGCGFGFCLVLVGFLFGWVVLVGFLFGSGVRFSSIPLSRQTGCVSAPVWLSVCETVVSCVIKSR